MIVCDEDDDDLSLLGTDTSGTDGLAWKLAACTPMSSSTSTYEPTLEAGVLMDDEHRDAVETVSAVALRVSCGTSMDDGGDRDCRGTVS